MGKVLGGADTPIDDYFVVPDGDFKFFSEGEETAFPFNFGLLESPGPGDFLVVGETLGQTTLPLIPTRLKGKPTGWNGQARATVGDQVDLVTGVPLVRQDQLSLPFNGSVFRLVRTSRPLKNPLSSLFQKTA
ncbi:MAG: hypothetical protein J0L78_08620 [Planctomycetes bacterium]|nr:hypothetical protein [Planctomycetota bacterium]